MPTNTSVTTNLGEYVQNYQRWTRFVRPAERLCINKRMSERGLEGAFFNARRTQRYKGNRRNFTATHNRRNATVSITPIDRSGQVLSLQATGGRVRFARGGAGRLQHLLIQRDRRFSRSTIYAKLKELRSSGTRRPGAAESGGGTLYYGTDGFFMAIRRSGTALYKRSGGNARQIAFLPSQATYKRTYDFPRAVNEGIVRTFVTDIERCFSENTVRHFRENGGRRLRTL